MRRVNYIVEGAFEFFSTTDYEKATYNGNRIVSTYLTDVDETTDKQKASFRIHRAKVRTKNANRA